MKNGLVNTEVSCDNCGEAFKIKKLKTTWIDDNVQRTYFICPHCNKEYTSYYTDKRIRKNIKEIEKLQKEYENIVKENREIMKELRERYEA